MKIFHRTGIAIFLSLSCLLGAQDNSAIENPLELFERRIGGRADKIMERLALPDAPLAEGVRGTVLRFYRDLQAVHHDRDTQLSAAPAADLHAHSRIRFEADKRAGQVHGELIGALARTLNGAQVEAVKDWMTFDMVALSVAEYDRMFPGLDERHRSQLRAWLVESREAAVIAGSAETKLDVFRVNKMRMHAYLGAQGLDVETALKAEEARKAAAKKPE